MKEAMELCFIGFIFFLLSTAAGCVKVDVFEYSFERGSPLRENYPKGEKIVFPKLILFKADKKKCKIEFTFPVGAYLWKDKSKEGYLFFKFLEKIFVTVGTFGVDMIDLRHGLRIPVFRELLWEIETARDDILIGFQCVPLGEDLLGDAYREDYVKLLFVVVFDFNRGRFYRVDILTGNHLPDGFYYEFLCTEDREIYLKEIQDSFYVKDNILYYRVNQSDKKLKTFKLPEPY